MGDMRQTEVRVLPKAADNKDNTPAGICESGGRAGQCAAETGSTRPWLVYTSMRPAARALPSGGLLAPSPHLGRRQLP
jgi:hypothetical protein